LAEGKNGDTDVYTFEATSGLEGVRALRVEALAHPTMNRGGPGRADNANIGLSRIRAWVSPVNGGPSNEVRFATARATFEQNPAGLSVKSALDADRGTGWAVDPKFGMDHAAVFECAEPLGYPDGTRWFVRLEFGLNTRHNIGRPRLSVATDPGLELKGSGTPAAVAAALEHVRTGKELTETERDVLKAWWKTSDPGWQAVHERLEAHRRAAPTARRERVLVCAEGYPAVRMHTQGADFFPETHFLQRGSTDQKRGVVRPGFLEVLLRGSEERWQKTPEAGARFSNRRRALAEWITDAERGAGHLAARVIVNRLWQHHFGQGLVATSNDFGTQGSRPSHPELLDWLAGELIRGGWRLKPIHQLIVSSAVYRQSSAVDTVRRDADPSNTCGRGGHPAVSKAKRCGTRCSPCPVSLIRRCTDREPSIRGVVGAACTSRSSAADWCPTWWRSTPPSRWSVRVDVRSPRWLRRRWCCSTDRMCVCGRKRWRSVQGRGPNRRRRWSDGCIDCCCSGIRLQTSGRPHWVS